MDYKKKYEKLVDAVKVLRDNNPSDEGIQNWVSDNVPELKESEDERIRKVLLGFLESELKKHGNEEWDGCIYTTDVIAWLEKQGSQNLANSEKTCKDEQKPVGWSEEDYRIFSMIATDVNLAHDVVRKGGADKERGRELAWLNFLRDQVLPHPKHEWSEEDEKTWKELIEEVKDQLDSVPAPDCRDKEDEKVLKQLNKWLTWLKSLKERYTWKPSEEQIKAIRLARSFVTDDFGDNLTLSEILIELEKQLKKL